MDVAVTGVIVAPSTAELVAGTYLQAFAHVAPADASNTKVDWSSEDLRYGTVTRQGLITAVAPGSCHITATTRDGGFTARLLLHVVAAPIPIPVASVQVIPRAVRTTLGAPTPRLRAVISPPNASEPNATWHCDDPSVATVDAQGFVRLWNTGRCAATASAGDVVSPPCPIEVFAEAAPGRAPRRRR
jgi:uncharacterized protein YjdB